MAQKVKGITVEIDGNVQPLNKRLKEVTDTAKKLDSELRVIDRLLKLDPSNTTLLAQKQKLLADSIANTKTKLKELTTAQEQAKAQLERGEIGADQYRALEREVIRAQNSLKYFESQAKQVDEALEQTENESKQAGEAFDEMGDAAQKSEKDMKSLSVGGVALGTVLGNVATKLLELAGNAATFLTDAVEETKEFRSDLSKLEQNAKAAGTGIDDVTDDLEYFVAITDETDSSVEALSNLLKAGFTGETLTDAVNNLSGAVVAFPDTLKIESLADSLQETLATGEATGQYGELLERLGVNLEDFNKGLQKCTTSAEKQQYAVDILAKNGMADLNAQYKEANADLIAYSTAQTRYTETLSKVGAAMQPVMTALTDTKTLLLEGMIPALETAGQALSEKLASPSVQNSFKKLGEGLAEVASAFANFAVFIIENGGLIVKIIGSIALGFAAWKVRSIIDSLGGLKSAIQAIIPAIKKAVTSINSVSSASIVGAIMTIASVIISLVSELGKASEATEELRSEAESLSDSITDVGTAFDKSEAEFAVNSDRISELISEISSLDSAIKNGGLTDADAAIKKGQLLRATNELNSVAGTTVATINEETGALNENLPEIESVTKAWLENARAQAYQETLIGILENQSELEVQRAMAIDTIRKNMDSLTKSEQEHVKALIDSGEYQELVNYLWAKGNTEIWAARDILSQTNYDIGIAAEQMDYLTDAANENGIALTGNTEALNENADAVLNLENAEAERLIRLQEDGQKLSEAQQAQLDTWKQNNAEYATELEEQLTREKEIYQARVDAATDMNNKIDLSNQTSLKQATENLEHNTQVTQEMVANLDSLYGRIPESLYTYLEEAGTDQARLISQLANEMEGGGSDVATRFVNAYLAAINAGKSPAEAAAYAFGSDTQTSAGQGIDSNKDAQTEFESSMQETVDNISAMVGADGPFYWLGIGIINRLASGMRAMAWKLYDVADNVVSTLKSKFNFEISVSSTGSGAKFQSFATGGIISREQIVRVAERGPEAIIPLDRLGGIIQGVLDNNGGGSGGNTYQLNVYTSDLSDGAQVRLFKNFSKWAGRRLN
jgi:methyl-accepting chemotaxis protein|nr:MAG TPA: minor tail protein [Bacteriophage sp.]